MKKFLVRIEEPRGDLYVWPADKLADANSMALDEWRCIAPKERAQASVYVGWVETDELPENVYDDGRILWGLCDTNSDDTCFSSKDLIEKSRWAHYALSRLDTDAMEELADLVDGYTEGDLGQDLKEALVDLDRCVERIFDKLGVTYHMRRSW